MANDTKLHDYNDYPILKGLKTPDEVKSLSLAAKKQLAAELRDFILNVTAHNGGHLASNLGVIELTIALISCFDFAHDKVVFDVGHQSYSWKILTDRKQKFNTLRMQGGISGFPKISESPYDYFGTGHSSTSISAALGMSRAMKQQRAPGHAFAVIGDGALTGGMAYEAMNDAGQGKDPLIIILNDNQMSIDHIVGGLAMHLEKLRVSPRYINCKKKWGSRLENGNKFQKNLAALLSKIKARGRVFGKEHSILFEQLGIRYNGPIDGHDINGLIRHIEAAKTYKGPVLIHVITQKGRGYSFAEEQPSRYHGVSPFPLQFGLSADKHEKTLTFSQAFSGALVEIATKDARIMAITPAMAQGSGLTEFQQRFPERFYDVAIAEQHALTMACGAASLGERPILAVYSTFLQRAYDQLIHDACLQNLPLILAVDRAGLVSSDGATHQGLYDIAMSLPLPNMTVLTPATQDDLKTALTLAVDAPGVKLIRYPRDKASDTILRDMDQEAKAQNAECDFTSLAQYCRLRKLMQGKKITVVCLGTLILQSLLACQQISEEMGEGLVDLFFAPAANNFAVEPIYASAVKTHKLLVMEDGTIDGGFAEALWQRLNLLQQHTGTDILTCPKFYFEALGVKHKIHGQATRAELFAAEGLNSVALKQKISSLLQMSFS